MADIKTAEEWKVVQSELSERLTSLKAEEQTLVNQIEQQRYYGSISLATLQQLASIRQQITDNTSSYDIATNQIEIASDSPQGTRANPTTSSNTPPVNPEPGNNTDLITTGTTAFELANIEPETITDSVNGLDFDVGNNEPVNAELPVIDDQEADLLQAQGEEGAAIAAANPAPPVIDDQEADLLQAQREEAAAIAAANPEPPVIDDQEADLLQAQREEAAAIGLGEQQKQIAINTQGLPVLAEDGSVAQGVAINPETGERYYTGDGPGTNPIVTASENTSVATGTNQARNNANALRETQFPEALDWRVRISLAPSATYLYNDAKEGDILFPLKGTRGVLFPYTPQISVSYNANYDATDLAHTNFKIYNYRNSSVDSINISGDFTAQDVNEANYVLAVIHFFRCVTKMFYGQDENPIRGVPPPLVYLTGYGQYGFDNHPMVINNFSLNYPTDVDYINAGYNLIPFSQTNYTIPNLSPSISKNRLSASKLSPGGAPNKPNFSQQATTQSITRVPTKLQIQITALPIVTRYDISNNFSLRDYAKGKLLQGSKRASGGGIW